MNFMTASLLLCFTVFTVHCYECNFPPSVWCSSKEIAQKCQVESQCIFYAWNNPPNAAPVNLTLYYESLCPGCKMLIKSQLYPVWNQLKNIMDVAILPYGNANVESQCMVSRWKETYTAAPVNFTVYIESLCPDCQNFIITELWPVWNKIKSIMNLSILPYGNAHEHKNPSTKKWVFWCQHGVDECVGNLIETCAINILKDVNIFFPFIHCIEISEDLPQKSAPECAKKLNIKYGPIKNCSESDMGNQLEHEMAVRTESLSPPHKYVPWITLNGVHTEEIQEKAESNLLELICDTYQGPKPEPCTKTSIYGRCPRV